MKLENIISDISIKQEDRSQILPARDYLIQLIKSYANNGEIPLLKSARLIGSYKRKTKIKPLDDIDFLLILGEGYHRGDNWHVIDDCNYIWTTEDKDSDGNISSVRLLNKIRSKLIGSYPNSQIKRNNEAVNVFLKSYGIGFDIVPCFYYRNTDYFLIPAGSQSTKWKRTNPIKDEVILDAINSNNNGKIKKVILLAKQFFKYKRIPSLRSYHLEAIAYYIFNEIQGDYQLSEYLVYFFKNLTNDLLRSCSDPTGLSEPLDSGLDFSMCSIVLSAVKEANMLLERDEGEYCKYVGYSS